MPKFRHSAAVETNECSRARSILRWLLHPVDDEDLSFYRDILPYSGCGTMRRYGRGARQPLGYFCFASSSDTAGRMITSSPFFQFTGVATLCLAVSCIESTTRSTSSKLRPVLIG